jgi:hypothetical protein
MRFSRRDRSFHDVIEGARRQVEEAIAERHRRLRGDRATKRTPAPQLIIPVKQASAEPKPRCASPAMNIASSDAFSRRHLASLVGFEGFRPLRPQAIWQAAVPTLPGSYAVIREASEPRAFSSKAGRVLQRAGPHSLDSTSWRRSGSMARRRCTSAAPRTSGSEYSCSPATARASPSPTGADGISGSSRTTTSFSSLGSPAPITRENSLPPSSGRTGACHSRTSTALVAPIRAHDRAD